MKKNMFFLLLFILVFLTNVSFAGNIKDFYFVGNIKVSESSVSSSDAKRKALEKARQKAFNTVLSRILVFEDIEKVLIPDSYNMEKFVQAIQLTNEKTTSLSYNADVNIQISKNLMIEYLKNQGLKVVNDFPPSTLVIFKRNLDFDFMKNLGDENIVPFVVYPSSAFSFDIDGADILKFQSVLNSVNNVVIVDVVSKNNGNYNIFIKDKLFGISEEVVVNDYQSIASVISFTINNSYKKFMLDNDNIGYISILLPVYSLNDWLNLYDKISKLSSFKDMEVQALKFNRVQLKVKYNYDLNSLISGLSSLGMSVDNKGDYLIIKR